MAIEVYTNFSSGDFLFLSLRYRSAAPFSVLSWRMARTAGSMCRIMLSSTKGSGVCSGTSTGFGNFSAYIWKC